MEERIDKNSVNIPDEIMEKWQNTVDIMAELINVPAALIMKAGPEYLEVIRSSRSNSNPYHTGENTPRNGLYCDTVINKKEKLLVPNALKSKKWKDNPDSRL